MKRIELQRLSLRNFKGIREFTLEVNGRNASVYGQNASGKSSVADALHYLLFEKDSAGRKNFGIKTLDEHGQALSGLEHEVEGVFLVDGEELTLRRVFTEVWSKRRGAATAEMTGHTTSHYVNGVPEKKAAYVDRISEIADEATWQLLTDPAAFQALHWQDRRRVLLDVVGDVTDEDVIRADAELADLPSILGKRSIDEHRKVVTARRAEVNKDLLQLPVRIDEVSRGLPAKPEQSQDAAEAALASLSAEAAGVSEDLARLRAGTVDTSAERKQLNDVRDRLAALMREMTAAHAEAVAEAAQAARQAEDDKRAITRAIEVARQEVARLERDVSRTEENLSRLRAEWQDANTKLASMHVRIEDACPVCKQDLPAERVKAAHAEALAQFNERKAKRLASLEADAQAHKQEQTRVTAELAEARTKVVELEGEIPALEAAAEAARQARTAAQEQQPERPAEWWALNEQEDVLLDCIEQLEARADTTEQQAALQERLSEIQAKQVEAQEALAAHKAITAGQQRITELKEQERTLAQEFERLEHELHLLETFTRTKVALLESKVSARFRTVSFKLFEQQVNGGITEVCTATVNGVPYEDVNHAGQIAAGLDIIRTLQEHHGITAPIVVDQAESIHDIPETGAQQIALIVSPTDPELRVELRETHMEEVPA